MPHLIDSDVVIDYLGGDLATKRLVDRLVPGGIAVSMITYMEVYQGLRRHPEPVRAQATFAAFLAHAPVLPFSRRVARRCAELRDALTQQGKRIRPRALDLITAATALEYRHSLVTRNLTDYADIPDLEIHQPG